jgi:hypothetical protein
MSISVNDLKTIAGNGGGMILDARKVSSSDLKIIASNASHTSARIILKNPHILSSGDLMEIASNGMGCVVFDFCEH